MLFILAAVNSLTCFMLLVMLIRTIWGLGGNVTTIESWEIARHHKLLRRARILGGYLDGPDGIRVRIERHEFPYDIGIWANMKEGMGSGNVLLWFWPFADTPRSNGLEFALNGFSEPDQSWPPPDPDRIPRLRQPLDPKQAFHYKDAPSFSNQEEKEAFHQRQRADLVRRQGTNGIIQRKTFHDRYATGWYAEQNGRDKEDDSTDSESESGEEGWKSPEGERLRDYGVDEDAEFYDQEEENVPLSELIRRRHGERSRDWRTRIQSEEE
jgi:palmitoyltransferase